MPRSTAVIDSLKPRLRSRAWEKPFSNPLPEPVKNPTSNPSQKSLHLAPFHTAPVPFPHFPRCPWPHACHSPSNEGAGRLRPGFREPGCFCIAKNETVRLQFDMEPFFDALDLIRVAARLPQLHGRNALFRRPPPPRSPATARCLPALRRFPCARARSRWSRRDFRHHQITPPEAGYFRLAPYRGLRAW